MVQPIIRQLRVELKKQHLSDVHIHIIGYNRDQRYFTHFTNNGGKLDVGDGDVKFTETGPARDKQIHTGKKEVDEFLDRVAKLSQQIEDDFQMGSDARAFREAMDYPFRVDATRTIIAVRLEPLGYSAINPGKQLAGTIVNELARKAGIALHLIEPVLNVKAPSEVHGQVIGEIINYLLCRFCIYEKICFQDSTTSQ